MELTLFNILLIIALAPLAVAAGRILIAVVLGVIIGSILWLAEKIGIWG